MSVSDVVAAIIVGAVGVVAAAGVGISLLDMIKKARRGRNMEWKDGWRSRGR